jgi:hypothetical protein
LPEIDLKVENGFWKGWSAMTLPFLLNSFDNHQLGNQLAAVDKQVPVLKVQSPNSYHLLSENLSNPSSPT